MVKKRNLYLIGFLFVLSLVFSIGRVKAHNPSSMTLQYNESSEILSVTISHSSDDFNTHYIFEAIITIDDNQAINQSYTSQPSNLFTYNYTILSWGLEILTFVVEVAARYTEAGINPQSITIGQRTHVSKPIPGFTGIWFIIGCSTIIFILFRNKKKKVS
jgi:hypothetical protein